MKGKNILCIGRGGLYNQCFPILNELDPKDKIWFFDDINTDLNLPNIITNLDELIKLLNSNFFDYYIILIANPKYRSKFTKLLKPFKVKPLDIINSNEIYGSYGNGCIILSQTLIEKNSKIGDAVLMNVASKVFHDSIVGDYSELMPNSLILGGSKIGKYCRIGSNAVIFPNIEICDNVIIGAGSLVNKNITTPGKYIGSPVKFFNS